MELYDKIECALNFSASCQTVKNRIEMQNDFIQNSFFKLISFEIATSVSSIPLKRSKYIRNALKSAMQCHHKIMRTEDDNKKISSKCVLSTKPTKQVLGICCGAAKNENNIRNGIRRDTAQPFFMAKKCVFESVCLYFAIEYFLQMPLRFLGVLHFFILFIVSGTRSQLIVINIIDSLYSIFAKERDENGRKKRVNSFVETAAL